MNLRKLYDSEVSYYGVHHKLTASSDWTPSDKSCGRPDNKYAPDPKYFAAAP